MKKNSGVSMIELVIIIIIMILIASFALYSGRGSIDKSDAMEVYTEISNVKKAVAGVMVQKELENGDETWLSTYYDSNIGNGWYEIYGIQDSNYSDTGAHKAINLDGLKRNYMVNYETGDVMLSKPVELFGSSVRTYEAVRAIVESDKM